MRFCALLFAVPLFAQPSPVTFENIIAKSGITFRMNNSVTPNKHQVETMIAGVGVLDYDNDGFMDIYFVNGAKLPEMDKSKPEFWNRLYHNNGDLTFTDVTEKAGVKGDGYGMGVAAGDFDNDGFTDLYLAGVNRNQLLRNNGDGTFADVTVKAGVAGIHSKYGKTWSISAGWFDYDNDGDLDLFVVNYVQWDIKTEPACSSGEVRAYCSPDSYAGLPDILYRNNGDGTFTDVSDASGIGKHIGKGMGVVFADLNTDGFTDIFVSNDTLRNFLFVNKGNGTFDETALLAGVAYNENGKSIAGMGADFKDIDNDGRPDIWVVAMIGDTFPLFRNRGRDFLDITSISGVRRATSGVTAWGAGVFDFDNDGNKDLFAACASILDNSIEIDRLPAELPNLLIRNNGNLRFTNVAAQAGPSFTTPARHRGAAFADFNNDGRMDIVVVVQNGLPELFVNQSSPSNHWLTLELKGKKSNRAGLGARVKITTPDGKSQYNHATTSVGYSTASDPRVHFGLGPHETVSSVEISWPSGAAQSLANVKTNQTIAATEPKLDRQGEVP
jgi:hypothetical protein